MSTPPAGDRRERYWLLVHDGMVDPVSWQDGERLLDVCVRVRSGAAAEQDFTFTPRGSVTHQQRTVRVSVDAPLDLVTAYDVEPDRGPQSAGLPSASESMPAR